MSAVHSHDIVVVGGGIAGSALATVLARDGLDVLVLERQTSFRDKVRGETMMCWGVAEMLRLGLEQPLLDAGGSYADHIVLYDEVFQPAEAEAAALPLGELLPGVAGVFDVGHPQACEALIQAAAAAGATVVRGIGDVEIQPGSTPAVRYEYDDVIHEVACRLIVGADVQRPPPARHRPGADDSDDPPGRHARRRSRCLAGRSDHPGHRG